MKKPILITTLGYPGSGKTYFSERLCKEQNFFHLNSDKTRFTIFKNPTFSAEETGGVFKLMDLLAEELLKTGISVVYDANMNFRIHRKKLKLLADRRNAKYRLVWIKTDIETAKNRLMKRGRRKENKLLYRPIELKWFEHYRNEIEQPTAKESYIIVNGNSSFDKQIKEFRKQVLL